MPSILLSTPENCPEPFNLADYVLNHAGAKDEKTALQIAGTHEGLSYGALRQSVLEVASAKVRRSLTGPDRGRAGDRKRDDRPGDP